MPTRIKICGVTRPEDAIVAAEAGAHAIGLVFHPPVKRNISIETARRIIAALPPFVTPVGLFVDAPVERVIETARELNLNHVQLHGRETPEIVRLLTGFFVLKAVRAEREGLARELTMWREAHLPHLRGITLETPGTQQAGGTGVSNDWDFIQTAQQHGLFDGLPPLIAAGGLNPDNVGDVVRRIRPFAVDVSSGVEETPGQKSKEKIEAFIRAVRDADA